MTSDTGVWLEELTWPEAKARFEADAVVVIPIGAASKAHGPHLPLKTDALTARALAQQLIERLPVVAAPVVGFGFYPAFTSFAGSQHLSAATFKALLRELFGEPAPTTASQRIVLMNTGVSTEKPIDEVAAGATDLLVLHMRWPGRGGRSPDRVAEGGHADERETSVMLALDPRSVRMDELALDGPLRADRRDRRSDAGDGVQGRAHPGGADRRHGGGDCQRWPDRCAP